MTSHVHEDNLEERLFPQLTETPEEIEYELRGPGRILSGPGAAF